MSTNDWNRNVEEYSEDLKKLTIEALQKITKSLGQSGRLFDTRMKQYFIKIANDKINQTVDYFEIQNLDTIAGSSKPHSDGSSDEVEFIAPIKIEPIQIDEYEDPTQQVSTSNEFILSPQTALRPPFTFQISMDRRSTCSPSTSNLPVTSPIYPTEEMKADDETEPLVVYTPTYSPEKEYDLKLEPTTPLEIDQCSPEIASTSGTNAQKRQQSTEIQCDSAKKQKIHEEEKSKRKMKYACMYCYHKNGASLEYTASETFEEVYEHWKKCHHSDLKPFKFFGIGLAACFHCGEIDAYPQLLKHHNLIHRSEKFVLVNPDDQTECALCHQQFTSIHEMVSHSHHEHNPISLNGVVNPICLKQSEIDKLLTKNAPSTVDRQIKKFICGNCSSVRDIHRETFCDHLEGDNFQFPCSVLGCTFISNGIHTLAEHEAVVHKISDFDEKYLKHFKFRLVRLFYRTRIIFNNGLVLYKHNILNSSYDDSEAFFEFRETFVKQKLVDPLQKFRLNEQKKLRDNICITGFKPNLTYREMTKVFKVICESIGILTYKCIIAEIVQNDANDIIVRVRNTNTKSTVNMANLIMKFWKRRNVNGFAVTCLRTLKFAIDGNVNAIRLRPDLTPFFKTIWVAAEAADRRNDIYNFYISKDGLMIQLSEQHDIQIIWSNSDLIEAINGQ